MTSLNFSNNFLFQNFSFSVWNTCTKFHWCNTFLYWFKVFLIFAMSQLNGVKISFLQITWGIKKFSNWSSYFYCPKLKTVILKSKWTCENMGWWYTKSPLLSLELDCLFFQIFFFAQNHSIKNFCKKSNTYK